MCALKRRRQVVEERIKPSTLIINVHHFAHVSGIVSDVIFIFQRSALCALRSQYETMMKDDAFYALTLFRS